MKRRESVRSFFGGPQLSWFIGACLSLSLCLLLAMGCETKRRSQLEPGAAAESHSLLLRPIPYPDPNGLEVSVERQLRQLRERLELRLSEPALEAEPESRKDLAEVIGSAGTVYHAYHLSEAARACYENAAHLAPEDARWLYYLGHTLQDAGELDAAQMAWSRSLSLAPSPTKSIHLARLELERNELAEAKRHAQRAMQSRRSAAGHLLLGRIDLREGKPESAVRHLEAALEIDPNAGEIHYSLGLAYRELGRLADARTHLSFDSRVPTHVEDPLMEKLSQWVRGRRLHQNRGSEFFMRKDYRRAAEEYRKAVAADPSHAIAHVNLGSVLTFLGERAQARKHFEQALSLDSQNALVLFNLGTLSAQENDDDAAIDYYQRSLAIEPRQRDAHFNLANALRRSRDYAKACEHYRNVLRQAPSHEDARLALGRTLLRRELYTEALASLEESHQALPKNVKIADALARVLAAAPDPTIRDGERAVSLAVQTFQRERNLAHLETLAMSYAERGDFDVAIEWLKTGIAAAEKQGRPDLANALRLRLGACKRGERWELPWPLDHPALTPPVSRAR